MERSNNRILGLSILAMFVLLSFPSLVSAQVIGAGPSGGTKATAAPPAEGYSSAGSLWLQAVTFRQAGLAMWMGTRLRTSIDPVSPAPLGQRSFVFVSQYRVKAGRR
jgi:hypothetical protein